MSCLGWGTAFEKALRLQLNWPWVFIALFGLFGISHLGVILNFLIPLNMSVSLGVHGLGIAFFFVFGHWTMLRQIHLKVGVSFFCLYFFICGFAITNNQYSDVNAYHFPTVQWIQNSKVVLGLANLQLRLGFNSLWHMSSAITNPFLRLASSNDYASILILFVFLWSLFFVDRRVRGAVLLTRLCALVIWRSVFLVNLGLPATDMPSAILAILFLEQLVMGFLDNSLNTNRVLLILFLLLFAIQVKLSQVFLVFPLVLCLWQLQGIKHLQLKQLCVLIGVFVVPWCFRAFLMSGCFAFPLQATCFLPSPWRVLDTDIQSIRSWIYSWPRMPMVSPSDVGSITHWFPGWWKNLSEKPYMVLWFWSGLLFLGSLLRRQSFEGKKGYIWLMASLVFVLAMWFMQAPDIRFISGVFIFTQSVFLLFLYQNLFFTPKVSALAKIGRQGQKIIFWCGIAVVLLMLQDFGRIALQSSYLQPVLIQRYQESDRFVFLHYKSDYGVAYKVRDESVDAEAGCWLERDLCTDEIVPNLMETQMAGYRLFKKAAP